MAGIVERLRKGIEWTGPTQDDTGQTENLMDEAADEITRLRAKVERLEEAVKDFTAECREYCFDECQSNCEPMTACRLFIARAALGDTHE